MKTMPSRELLCADVSQLICWPKSDSSCENQINLTHQHADSTPRTADKVNAPQLQYDENEYDQIIYQSPETVENESKINSVDDPYAPFIQKKTSSILTELVIHAPSSPPPRSFETPTSS